MREYPYLYSQRDPQWANNQLGTAPGATIGLYGCILTSHAMKAGYYGHQITPAALNDIYTQRNLYVSQDLLTDADINAVFPDITLVETQDYSAVPADLAHIQQLAQDPNITITVEVDFDHNPSDGIESHFVELHSYDGTTMMIYDSYYGSNDDFTLHYGTNIAQTIQKIAVYKGTPVAAPVQVDAATFEKLVTNSTSYDKVCDAVGEPHDTAGDKVVADINKIKADKAADDQTVNNLNKQIPDLEGQISTLNNQVTDLQQKLSLAQNASTHPDSGLNYQDLYNQAESDIKDLRAQLEQAQQTYNRAMGQYQNTSALLMPRQQLFQILIKRLLNLQ